MRPADESFDAYVLCTSPRSGSTLLNSLLAATGVAGKPRSFFHRASVDSWASQLAAPPHRDGRDLDFLRAVVDAAIVEGTGDTGMFGLRLQRHSFDFFTSQLRLLYPGLDSDAARFRAAFGRTFFIHLTRPDKVAQAVSCVKAEQTGLWHMASDGTALERVKPPQDAVYDRAALQREYDEMVDADQEWLAWFSQEGIEPLRLSYDRLSADPLAVLRETLRALHLDEQAADGVEVGVQRLADTVNRDWIQRFRGDLIDATPHSRPPQPPPRR